MGHVRCCIRQSPNGPCSGGEPSIVPGTGVHIDRAFVSRVLIGALSDHEQRRLIVRLLGLDRVFRLELMAALQPFEMFDVDLVAEYERVLEVHSTWADPGLETARQALLVRAHDRAPDLDELIRGFTFEDLVEIGETTRELFSWTMAEHLLERARGDFSLHVRKTSLYLATTVIDVVDILGAAGHSRHFPQVVANVRSRIRAAERRTTDRS